MSLRRTKGQTQATADRRRTAPWHPIFDAGQESQPQGLLDFPPTTNVSVTSDVSLVRLLRIQMSNLFFTLVTVGAYRFWGLTRLRRTIWDAVSLSGSRLIYRGTGLELFISTLAAVVVLLLPVTMIWGTLLWLPIGSWLFVGTCLVALLFLFVLHFVGRFYRARYLAERTIWRGVRGELRGNAFQYALVALWHGFLVILTAGLWWPRMQMRLSGYLVSNASLGNFNPKWVEQRSGLFSAWLLAWSVGLFAIVCGLGWMSFRVAGPETGDGLGFAEPLLLTASLISGFACFLLFCAYQVALVRAKVVSLSLDDLFVFSSVQFSHIVWLNARIVLVQAFVFMLVSVLALLLYSTWAPWVENLSAAIWQMFTSQSLVQDTSVTPDWIVQLLTVAGLLAMTRVVALALVPILRVNLWQHLHARTLVFEGQLDFSKTTQVQPGRHRTVGEGVALALDAGGL